MDYTLPIIERYNAALGAIIGVLAYVFGDKWFLFLAFFGLNVLDWITGWMKSRIKGIESSAAGWTGILKKLGYWIMIAVGFSMSAIFIEIGKVINIDLQVTTLLGWFVLASLAVNEFRSILENLVEGGYNPPQILIKGLDVASKLIDQKAGTDGTITVNTNSPDKDVYKLNLDIPIDSIKDKDEIRLKVDIPSQ